MKIAKNLKFGYLLTLLPMLLSSCATVSTIPLEVMRPADYSVPPDVLSVVVVDFSFPFRGDSTHVLSLSPRKTTVVDTIWIDDYGMRVAESMAYELDNRAFFDSVFLHPVSLNRPPAGRPNLPLSANQVGEILKNYNAQAVIALESVEYRSRFKTESLEGYYYASLDANSRLLWKIYNAQGQTMDAFIQQDSIFWDNSDLASGDFSSIPGLRYAIESLADFMGKYYPDRIAPYWESQRRSYYSSGHHLFVRANDLLKANNWDHAARVWYNVFDEGNDKQKAMAAFNIALSFEVRGDFEEAVAWAQVSKKLLDEMNTFRVSNLDKIRTIMYIEELNERISEIQKLEEQVGAGV